MIQAPLEEIVQAAPALHSAGTFSEVALRALARWVHGGIRCSAETGSGASTLLLSHLSEEHLVFSVDGGNGSLGNVRSSPFFRKESTTIVEGPTQLTLPLYRFARPLDFVLIDGPHGFPFPDLEYYYFYPQMKPGGVLVLDDIQIRTIQNLFEFIKADDMWRLEEVVETTAFFVRTDAETFSPTCDGWWLQGYNRR